MATTKETKVSKEGKEVTLNHKVTVYAGTGQDAQGRNIPESVVTEALQAIIDSSCDLFNGLTIHRTVGAWKNGHVIQEPGVKLEVIVSQEVSGDSKFFESEVKSKASQLARVVKHQLDQTEVLYVVERLNGEVLSV